MRHSSTRYTDNITVIARPGGAHCIFIFATTEFKLHFGWGGDFMRICWRVVAVAFICFPIPSVALVPEDVERHQPEIHLFGSMPGNFSPLKCPEPRFARPPTPSTHHP